MQWNHLSLQTLTIRLLLSTLALLVPLSACSAPGEIPPVIAPTSLVEEAPAPTLIPALSATPVPTPTAVRTPPALPNIFIPESLNPVDTPRAYVKDNCQYLKNRWDTGKAAPGTVVMIIMINDINRGSKPDSPDGITRSQFGHMIENIKELGFEAINAEQLAGFLERNRYIPLRSVLFVQDGRRNAENFEQHFRPQWTEWGWPVVNSWIIQSDTTDTLLQENLALEQEGFVDHQLYSSLHRFSTSASEGFLSDQLKNYTDIFEERFNKAPLAITWPGKPGLNFPRAARGLGIRLGFTTNARGPVMYNWIPQADNEDPSRPAYYPEGPYDDPLMTLPRFWPSQVVDSLDKVRLIGKFSAEYAEQNKEIELEYYDIVCAQDYGPISSTP